MATIRLRPKIVLEKIKMLRNRFLLLSSFLTTQTNKKKRIKKPDKSEFYGMAINSSHLNVK